MQLLHLHFVSAPVPIKREIEQSGAIISESGEAASLGAKKEKRRLQSTDIGKPQDFTHVVHVEPPLCRRLQAVDWQDPDVRSFLEQAGVTSAQLERDDIRIVIAKFILDHGMGQIRAEVRKCGKHDVPAAALPKTSRPDDVADAASVASSEISIGVVEPEAKAAPPDSLQQSPPESPIPLTRRFTQWMMQRKRKRPQASSVTTGKPPKLSEEEKTPKAIKKTKQSQELKEIKEHGDEKPVSKTSALKRIFVRQKSSSVIKTNEKTSKEKKIVGDTDTNRSSSSSNAETVPKAFDFPIENTDLHVVDTYTAVKGEVVAEAIPTKRLTKSKLTRQQRVSADASSPDVSKVRSKHAYSSSSEGNVKDQNRTNVRRPRRTVERFKKLDAKYTNRNDSSSSEDNRRYQKLEKERAGISRFSTSKTVAINSSDEEHQRNSGVESTQAHNLKVHVTSNTPQTSNIEKKDNNQTNIKDNDVESNRESRYEKAKVAIDINYSTPIEFVDTFENDLPVLDRLRRSEEKTNLVVSSDEDEPVQTTKPKNIKKKPGIKLQRSNAISSNSSDDVPSTDSEESHRVVDRKSAQESVHNVPLTSQQTYSSDTSEDSESDEQKSITTNESPAYDTVDKAAVVQNETEEEAWARMWYENEKAERQKRKVTWSRVMAELKLRLSKDNESESSSSKSSNDSFRENYDMYYTQQMSDFAGNSKQRDDTYYTEHNKNIVKVKNESAGTTIHEENVNVVVYKNNITHKNCNNFNSDSSSSLELSSNVTDAMAETNIEPVFLVSTQESPASVPSTDSNSSSSDTDNTVSNVDFSVSTHDGFPQKVQKSSSEASNSSGQASADSQTGSSYSSSENSATESDHEEQNIQQNINESTTNSSQHTDVIQFSEDVPVQDEEPCEEVGKQDTNTSAIIRFDMSPSSPSKRVHFFSESKPLPQSTLIVQPITFEEAEENEANENSGSFQNLFNIDKVVHRSGLRSRQLYREQRYERKSVPEYKTAADIEAALYANVPFTPAEPEHVLLREKFNRDLANRKQQEIINAQKRTSGIERNPSYHRAVEESEVPDTTLRRRYRSGATRSSSDIHRDTRVSKPIMRHSMPMPSHRVTEL